MTTSPMASDPIPLYARGSHTFSRALAVGAVGMTAIGLVVGAYELARTRDLVGLALVAFFGLVGYSAARTILRARPIFGSAEGLVVGAGPERRTIPWSNIGEAQIPLASFNPVFRMYYLDVRGETKRIYFFGGKGELERIEEFRRRARGDT